MGTETNALATQPNQPTVQKDVRALIMSDAFQTQIKKAMPQAMSSDVLLRVSVTTIQKTPKLLECTRESLMQCVLECAQLGLLPDGILGQAYMVPYGKNATLQIGYRGIITLARRSGEVKYVVGEAVYDCDKFSISYAPKRTIMHDPDIDNERRGEKLEGKYLPAGFRGAYGLVLYKDDTIDFEYLPLHKIERIRSGSQAGSAKDGPWLQHFEEMAKKTAIRALGKRLPLSADDLRNIVQDEYRESGVDMGTLVSAAVKDVLVTEGLGSGDVVEADSEALGIMQRLGWAPGRRTQAINSYKDKPEALLAYLKGEEAKTKPATRGRAQKPAATAEQPAQEFEEAGQTIEAEPHGEQSEAGSASPKFTDF